MSDVFRDVSTTCLHQNIVMSSNSNPDDEHFELIDVSDARNRNWMSDVFRDVSKASAAKQITIGGVSGWVSGYMFAKIGKVAATAVGGSLLLIQIAQHQGYIKIDWKKVEKEFNQASKTVKAEARKSDIEEYIYMVQDFARKNMFLAGGFAGGFLIGLAS